jgi:GNAT superfamily N-acetyltransferase
MSPLVHLDYLANHEELIPELARLHFAEWSYLRPAETPDERTVRLRNCCGLRAIPTAIVAISSGLLRGSALLLQHDMDTRLDLAPWLAGVYVASSDRHQGVGSALVQRIEREAALLGVTQLHLYTSRGSSFYERLGWQSLERCTYLGERVTIMRKKVVA